MFIKFFLFFFFCFFYIKYSKINYIKMNTDVFINKSNSFNPIKSYDFTIDNKYKTNINEMKRKK